MIPKSLKLTNVKSLSWGYYGEPSLTRLKGHGFAAHLGMSSWEGHDGYLIDYVSSKWVRIDIKTTAIKIAVLL